MKIGLDVVLKDVPGQLVKALEPISRFGGNIISIVHRRESIKGGRVAVHVTIEVENSGRLEKMIKALEKNDIWVSKVGEVKKKKKLTAVLIGHIVDTDMRDTIDRINEIPGVMVADVNLAMPHPEKESSAIIDIEVSGREKVKIVMKRLEEIAGEKNLLIIRSLEVEV
ncbi:MAG: ACT domain-containing protein [Candidatus Hydrothermarchaeaceae archaeon]